MGNEPLTPDEWRDIDRYHQAFKNEMRRSAELFEQFKEQQKEAQNISRMIYFIDGNQVCCMRSSSKFSKDVCGFGDSLKDAFLDLIGQTILTQNDVLEDWELEFMGIRAT